MDLFSLSSCWISLVFSDAVELKRLLSSWVASVSIHVTFIRSPILPNKAMVSFRATVYGYILSLAGSLAARLPRPCATGLATDNVSRSLVGVSRKSFVFLKENYWDWWRPFLLFIATIADALKTKAHVLSIDVKEEAACIHGDIV